MPSRRPPPVRRWLTATTWPVGVALTSWDYMWRTTVMRRRETEASFPDPPPEIMSYPGDLAREGVQGHETGCGPLFHRVYRTHVRESPLSAEQLMERIQSKLNRVAPIKFARFQLTRGERGKLSVGDEYVVRMPGPWDGPVRVVAKGPRSFRLATLSGHLEAGQIEFKARPGGDALVFEIESWARSSSRLVHLLYHRLRMAKEVQAHMWISFLERVVDLAEGRMTGGIQIETERIEIADRDTEGTRVVSASPLLGSPRIRRRLAQLEPRSLNFDPAALADASPATGWTITDRCQQLPGEPPGMPVERGSWQIARRLMRGYEFADPSIVRAYYDPEIPLKRRNMLLELRALGIARVFVGVRVAEVYEEARSSGGRRAYVWGWAYRTLEGHVEMGQMDWEVWKWLDDGGVEFRVHAVSRVAPIHNPVVWIGFHLLRGPERRAFLDSTQTRMLAFTELALSRSDPGQAIRDAARELTARSSRSDEPAHDAVARSIRRG